MREQRGPEPGEPPANREPPHNLEAEQALLGAILINNRAYERVSEFLLTEHFADPVNGRIFKACGRLIDRGQIATPVTLKGVFDQDEALKERSDEHTSELQSLMRISYAVFCLKKKKK